jgi:hypothetical protein
MRISTCRGTKAQCSLEPLVRQFVATAVTRQNLHASYTLVTPKLRQGMSRSAWATGAIPVQPFPRIDWDAFALRFSDRQGGVLFFHLHLRSQQPTTDEADFWIGLARYRGDWRVAYFTPAGLHGATPP